MGRIIFILPIIWRFKCWTINSKTRRISSVLLIQGTSIMPSFKKMFVAALAIASGEAFLNCAEAPKQVFAWGVAVANDSAIPHYALYAELNPLFQTNITVPTTYFFAEGFAANLTEFTYDNHTEKVVRMELNKDVTPINFLTIPKQIVCNGSYEMNLRTLCGTNGKQIFCNGSRSETIQFLAMAKILFDEVKRNQTCPIDSKATSEIPKTSCAGQKVGNLALLAIPAALLCCGVAICAKVSRTAGFFKLKNNRIESEKTEESRLIPKV